MELNKAKKHFGQQKWEKVRYSWIEIAKENLNYSPDSCPHCKTETLITITIIEPERGPPTLINNA